MRMRTTVVSPSSRSLGAAGFGGAPGQHVLGEVAEHGELLACVGHLFGVPKATADR